jgi:hypothetical protein
MAISPNTDFTSGQILTAAQQNKFPRGVMAYTQVIVNDNSITSTEEVQITSSAFTAVANRYYRITYYDPQLFNSSSTYFVARIRLTNLAGAELQTEITSVPANLYTWANCVTVQTFSAGSVVLVATLESTGTGTASRNSSKPAFILVEDIGGA